MDFIFDFLFSKWVVVSIFIACVLFALFVVYKVIAGIFAIFTGIYNLIGLAFRKTMSLFRFGGNIRQKCRGIYESIKDSFADMDTDSYDTSESSKKDYNVLRALDHFYRNRQLYLEVCANYNTVGADREQFISDIYELIQSKPELRYSTKYKETHEDYIWSKNAFFMWDTSTTTFSKQFDKTLNKQSYKQEKRDYRGEWEQFKQNNTDYRERYREFNRGSNSGNKGQYYAILGLSDNVTDIAKIKLAYKSKMKQYHPDRYANSSIEEQIKNEAMSKKVNEAYSYFEKIYA